MAVDCTPVSSLMNYLVSKRTRAFLLTLDYQKVTTLRITDVSLLVQAYSMSNFNDWYKQTLRPLPYSRDGFKSEMRKAYEAGAASQEQTLRDKFAASALISPAASRVSDLTQRASISYQIADAMLEARKQK